MKITNTNRGYTLVELVIVIMVMLVVGGIVVGILYSAIRGTTKAKTNTNISQNGNFAVTFLTNFLINSKRLLYITDITDGTQYGNCVAVNPIAASSITVEGFDGGVTTLACMNNTVSSNSASLLNTSEVQIAENSCSFTCYQENLYSPPRIDISFELVNAGATTPETSVPPTLFNTSVTLRNFE